MQQGEGTDVFAALREWLARSEALRGPGHPPEFHEGKVLALRAVRGWLDEHVPEGMAAPSGRESDTRCDTAAPSDEARKAVAQVVHETWCDNCKTCSGLYDDDYIAADVALRAIDLPRLLAEARAEEREKTNVPCVACGWTPKPGPPQPPDRMMLVSRQEVEDLRALLPEVEDAAVLYEAAADRIVALKAELPRVRAEERAATLREARSWLQEELRLALSHGNHDHAAIRRLEQRFAAEFNPEAEPKRPRNHAPWCCVEHEGPCDFNPEAE